MSELDNPAPETGGDEVTDEEYLTDAWPGEEQPEEADVTIVPSARDETDVEVAHAMLSLMKEAVRADHQQKREAADREKTVKVQAMTVFDGDEEETATGASERTPAAKEIGKPGDGEGAKTPRADVNKVGMSGGYVMFGVPRDVPSVMSKKVQSPSRDDLGAMRSETYFPLTVGDPTGVSEGVYTPVMPILVNSNGEPV